jgi:hypothetical protein
MTKILTTTPPSSLLPSNGPALVPGDGQTFSASSSQFIESIAFEDNPHSPRKRTKIQLSIGALLLDAAEPRPLHFNLWEKSRRGGTNTQEYEFKQCQLTLKDCPACLFSYCILYEQVAYTSEHFGDSDSWLNADFVNTFFLLCHHDTHDAHQF